MVRYSTCYIECTLVQCTGKLKEKRLYQRRDGKHLVDKLIGQLVEALGGIGKSRGDKDNNFQPPSKVIERDKNVPGENSEK